MAYAKRKTKKPAPPPDDNQAVALPDDKGAVTDDWHGKLITWVNESDDASTDSRALSEKCRDYYDSIQTWTAEERKKMNARRQPCTVINRCKPKMDALMGMEKAAKTTAKAFPRTPKHEMGAEAATEGIRFVLQDNAFDQIRSAVWDNLLIEGSAGAEVIVEPGEGDEMRVTINHLMWDRLIWDPHARRKDLADARYKGQVIWLDYDMALERFPDGRDVLESMQEGSQTYDDKPRWMDNTRRRCKIVELYYRRDGEMWYACFTRGGYLKDPQVCPYVDEEGNTEDPYEFASLFVTREGDRYGAMRQLLDVQDEINKRRAKALHLMSVRQTFGHKGAVEDLNAARQQLARPDGHLEVNYGEFGKDFGVLPTGDMAQAQFNLLTEAKMEIDAVGANSATQGKDHTVQSGRALIERRNAGQTEVGPMFDVLRYWQYRMFRKVWNRIRQYWKAEKWIRVTDDEHNLRWVGLNAPITKGQMLLEDAQAKGIPPEQLQQLQAQIQADPSMSQVVDTKNLLADLDVDIIISEVPDVLNQQAEDFQTLGEMVKSGLQLPTPAIIEASPFSPQIKEKIMKALKESPQIPPQVQEQMQKMQEALQKAGEEAQRLAQENQALKADQSSEMAKINASTNAKGQQFAAEHQMKVDQANAEHQLEIDKATAAHQLAVDKAKLDAATKVTVAEISAKASTEQTLIEAERDANLELSGALGGEGGAAAQPAAPKKITPLQKIAEMHAQAAGAVQETAAQHQAALQSVAQTIADSMAGVQAILAELLQATKNPPARNVRVGGVQRDSSGSISGASVTVQ